MCNGQAILCITTVDAHVMPAPLLAEREADDEEEEVEGEGGDDGVSAAWGAWGHCL